MLNFINQINGQINLENTVWMFNAEFTTIYQNRYDFVKFNIDNEIEYLNGEGNLIRKDTLEINKEGNFIIKNNPFFRGIEFISSNEINLVLEVEHFENDKSTGIKDMKFNLLKLPLTQIEVNKESLKILSSNSDWELEMPNKEKKNIKLSTWEYVSKEEIVKILEDSRKFAKYKKTNHLIQIENSVVLVRQRLNLVDSKAIITKISEDELVMKAENKDWILKRVK
jgi:hypothetical protein